MTTPLQALAPRFRFNEGLLKMATDGFTDETWSLGPDGGGNTAHWILGHVTHARNGLLRMAGAEVAPEPWEEAFGRGATPTGDGYLPVEELVAKFRAAGEALSSHLAGMSEEDAAAPAPREFPDGSKTIGDAAHFMYFHETYHLGQIGLIRRMGGLPGFV
jgi:uncharacterized damage-inducible protein DinB